MRQLTEKMKMDIDDLVGDATAIPNSKTYAERLFNLLTNLKRDNYNITRYLTIYEALQERVKE